MTIAIKRNTETFSLTGIDKSDRRVSHDQFYVARQTYKAAVKGRQYKHSLRAEVFNRDA